MPKQLYKLFWLTTPSFQPISEKNWVEAEEIKWNSFMYPSFLIYQSFNSYFNLYFIILILMVSLNLKNFRIKHLKLPVLLL